MKKAAVISLAFVVVLCAIATAQKRKGETGPRALGVVEIMANGRARLTPITILVDGKWYDAGLYMASPRPMALEPEIVYEGEKSGEPEGLFTVTAAQQMQGSWIGLGVWKPKGSEQAKKEPDATKKPAAARDDDEGPPRLRRGSSGSTPAEPTPPAPASTTAPNAGSGPAGSSQASGQAPATPSPAKPEDKAQSAKSAPPVAEDPNRPVLRRGKPAVEQAEEIAPDQPATTSVASKTSSSAKPGANNVAKSAGPVFTKTLAAISDAAGPEPRSYAMELRPAERQQYEATMMKMASEAIRTFSVTHPIRGRQVPNVTLTDIQVPAFDVNTSNEPVLVLTAKAVESAAPASAKTEARPRAGRTATTTKPAQAAQPNAGAQSGAPATTGAASQAGTATQVMDGFSYYVTVVARVDVNGDVRKLFTSVTDNSHLDAIPRLQLIDCVDANGDQSGELLFRQLYDRSRAYVVYRVGMDRLWELFEGAQSTFVAGQ